MKIFHYSGDSVEALLQRLPRKPTGALILCHATTGVEALDALCEQVSARYEDTPVLGVTTDEVIVEGRIADAPLVVMMLRLEDAATLELRYFDGLDASQAAACADWLDHHKDAASLALTWCAGESADVDRFWQRIRLPMPLAGGVVGQSGDGQRMLWAAGRLRQAGCAVAVVRGGALGVRTQAGWRSVTRTHRVTRAEDGCVQAIDHRPAIEFYRRYLDVETLSRQQLFEVGLAFPLTVELQPEQWVIRGVIRFNEDGSLQCVGDVPQGAHVRMAVGSPGRLLREAQRMVCCAPGRSMLTFFCLGRKLILRDQTQMALSLMAGSAFGFFSFGELHAAPGEFGRLLNHTTVCIAPVEDVQNDRAPEQRRTLTPTTADLLVNLLAHTHEEAHQIERLLSRADQLVLRFEWQDERWRVAQAIGKTALLGCDQSSLLEGAVNPLDQLDTTGQAAVQRFLAQGAQARTLHTRLRQVHGRWLSVSLLMLRDGDQMLWLLEDMSTEQALTRIYEMFERGPVVQFEWSGEPGWPIRYVSPNVEQVLGLPYEPLARGLKRFADFVHPEDLPGVRNEVRRFLKDRVVDFHQEYRIVSPSGEQRWVRDYTHVIYAGKQHPETIYGFVIDITREKEALRQLEAEKKQAAWQAMHDPLTGLYNRTYLAEIFPALLRQARRHEWVLALMFIDLDNFKEINDVHGHSVGDEILRQFSRRLRALLRGSDLIARFGGDEFVIVAQIEERCYDKAADRARVLAEKILDMLQTPFEVDSETFRLSASVGIVLVDQSQTTDFDTLIRYADTSMYLAKRSGRNGYRFFDERQQRLEEARALKLTALRQAIEQGELWLAYQPQVQWDGQRFHLCGAEVLMRWQSQQFGAVSPGEFIPLAEDTGYILTLGNWMIEAALKQLARWRQRKVLPQHFVLSLNISAVQFYEKDFVDTLCRLCQTHDIPPQAVRLELTERIIYKGTEAALARMKQLRAFGFSTSLDDFGTGYSSLAYLKQMDLDELKIDQTFVRNFLQDESNAVLTRTIIDLARNFHLAPIAEGTERDEEVCALVKMGCSTFQGYFFGKPMSAEVFECWMADNPLAQLSLQGC